MRPSTFIRHFLTTLAGAGMVAASAGATAATWVYVANADSQDISVFQLDRAAGTLRPVATVSLGGTAMPMVVSRDKIGTQGQSPAVTVRRFVKFS